MKLLEDFTRNVAIANRSRVSCIAFMEATSKPRRNNKFHSGEFYGGVFRKEKRYGTLVMPQA